MNTFFARAIAVFALFLAVLAPFASFAATYVNGYYRSNGTYVNGYYRSTADGNPYNNYSYPGNTNPYTGVTAGGNTSTYLNNYYNSYTPSYTTSYRPTYTPSYTSTSQGTYDSLKSTYDQKCGNATLLIGQAWSDCQKASNAYFFATPSYTPTYTSSYTSTYSTSKPERRISEPAHTIAESGGDCFGGALTTTDATNCSLYKTSKYSYEWIKTATTEYPMCKGTYYPMNACETGYTFTCTNEGKAVCTPNVQLAAVSVTSEAEVVKKLMEQLALLQAQLAKMKNQ